MLKKSELDRVLAAGRTIREARPDDPLGPLSLLPGTWKNCPNLPGRGWNMIALPFAATEDFPFNYRLLLNQYNEELKFDLVDKGVPNRGIAVVNRSVVQADQFLVALDYEQIIFQIAAEDFPESGQAGGPKLPIHHEPGLWLYMLNEAGGLFDIARLATIPHGDSVLALGHAGVCDGPPTIPDISGLPIGHRPNTCSNRYMEPYRHFHENPFQGVFDPLSPNDLLKAANEGVKIVRTTELDVDTDIPTGGIHNIPFIVQQANATSMKATFWIQELEEKDSEGKPKLRLQYSQTVMLDFFQRVDGVPGLIRWPHISINTLEKAPYVPGVPPREPDVLCY